MLSSSSTPSKKEVENSNNELGGMGAIGGDELSSWEKRKEDGGIGIGGYCGGKEERILVSVRLRPLNETELMNKDPCEWECINETTVTFRNNLPERSMYPTAYTFDRVFGCDSTTRRVYEESAKEVALSVVKGINSSIFAYGQTSSGKTYTMTGVTEYSVSDIYDYVQSHQERAFVLKFSAMEIYNEAVRDLLSSDNSPLRLLDDPERGPVVEKLTEEILRDRNHLKELLSICEAQRQIGETSLNETSSRSHQILRLSIESSARQFINKNDSSTLSATVNFVDLAGSERASQAMSAGTRLKEGCHINRSLLTLGTVIRKLSKGRNGHIPYRDSKLTRILQPSLGGNARTAIICTMSPARSYIEQSRNTLLFASCAKEVTTNAHVNVVMSDKALVKHLQKELARLESEIRYPSSPGVSNAYTLLKEKEFQILQMEKEMKELMQQRDFSQSRLEDLLQSIGNNQVSRHWEINDDHVLYATNACHDDNSLSESSSISYPSLDFGHTKLSKSPDSADESDVSSEPGFQFFEKQSKNQDTSPKISNNRFDFEGLLQNNGETEDKTRSSSEKFENLTDDKTRRSSEEFENLCKEVRCIEMDETSMSTSGVVITGGNNSLLLPLEVASSNYVDHKTTPNLEEDDYSSDYVVKVQEDKYSDNHVPEVQEDKYLNNCVSEVTVCTLEEQLQNAKKADAILRMKQNLKKTSPWSSDSRSSMLSRSRSCRQSVSHGSPPWFVVEEENESTPPPSRLFSDFPERPEWFSTRVCGVNYNDVGKISGEEFKSESRSSNDDLRGNMHMSSSEEDISGICDFVTGMKEMAQIQYQKQCASKQEGKEKASEDLESNKAVKDVSVEPALNPIEFHSRCPDVFEKQQEEIIILWHECNVSLVHRTHFFLLFKGDPADSIYIEVELRRLSYLKQTFNHGSSVHKSMTNDGCIVTPASSSRAMHHEREMLSRKMRKTLSSSERKSLYQEWGIALDSKQRRLQLANLLWSETNDMNHIRASASIVAKLIGLLEKGKVLKEMFGFSFTRRSTNRRSYSWRH